MVKPLLDTDLVQLFHGYPKLVAGCQLLFCDTLYAACSFNPYCPFPLLQSNKCSGLRPLDAQEGKQLLTSSSSLDGSSHPIVQRSPIGGAWLNQTCVAPEDFVQEVWHHRRHLSKTDHRDVCRRKAPYLHGAGVTTDGEVTVTIHAASQVGQCVVIHGYYYNGAVA